MQPFPIGVKINKSMGRKLSSWLENDAERLQLVVDY
jgi:hypothetical protein